MAGTLGEIFNTLGHGVYVVGVAAEGRHNAFTAAWVMQTSFDPPMLALSISPAHSSYTLLRSGGCFTVNVLEKGRLDLAEHFGRPALVHKLASVAWRPGRSGAPILTDALAWFECDVSGDHPAGDHRLVVGRVFDGAVQNETAEPMSYRNTGQMDGSASLFPERFPERN